MAPDRRSIRIAIRAITVFLPAHINEQSAIAALCHEPYGATLVRARSSLTHVTRSGFAPCRLVVLLDGIFHSGSATGHIFGSLA